MSETNDIAKPSSKPFKHVQGSKKQATKRRPWWVWALWTVFILCIALVIGAALAWSNRYALLEDLAIDTLARDGIEAELSIERLNKTHAILNNVKLRHDGALFFSAKRVTADYLWRDALEGRMKSVTIKQPQAHITIDKKGKIIDGWLPPSAPKDDETAQNRLPENGLTLQAGEFFIQSPYGDANIRGDINLKSPQDYDADLTLSPTDLTYNDMTLSGGGTFDVKTTNGKIELISQIDVSNLSHPAIDAKDIELTLNGRPDIDARSFQGTANLTFGKLESAQAFMDKGQISWDGSLAKTTSFFDLSGELKTQLTGLNLPDPARREELADTLSFYTPLSKSPVAQNFIPEMRETLKVLLTDSDVTGQANLIRNDTEFQLTLLAPATIQSDQTRLTITPKPSAPAYRFDRNAQTIHAFLDASFTNPAGLRLKDGEFKARSINGVRLDGVKSFKTNISTGRVWTAKGIDGRAAKLAPMNVQMNYNGEDINNRKVTLIGGLGYDGILPGAYVQGLSSAGRMDLNLIGTDKLEIGYRPNETAPLKIKRLETTTDWVAHDVKANIKTSVNLFTRNAITNDSAADISLSNLSTRLERGLDGASLNLTADSLTANGDLTRETALSDILNQNWKINFTQGLITSDNLPGPETKITVPDGQLTADLMTGQPISFDMRTASANIQTQLVKADNMALRLHGQTDDFDIEHNGGRVKLANNNLPPLPIEGQLNVKDGHFIGTANARLPQADNTPIALSYDIHDGIGYADVDIEALEFSPNGLQPQNLISALRGKIAQVEGLSSAKIRLEFSRNQPLQSSGTAKIINMNLGTAPGPLTGMNMELTMDSVLPLISRGRQRITVAQFDPGIPLFDGVIDFELIDGGVKIFSAKWPIEDGFFELDPFTWKYGAEENRLTMRLSNVELGEFMKNMGNDDIEATGQLQGEFPIVISGVNLRVDNGHLTIKDGGTIRYNPKTPDGAPPISYTQDEAIKILRTKDQARYSSLARDALREFQYKELSVRIDGALDGEVELHTIFNGSNAKVLNGQPFEFDINVVGELFNILRSFDSNAQIKSQLEKQGVSTDGLSITPQ